MDFGSRGEIRLCPRRRAQAAILPRELLRELFLIQEVQCFLQLQAGQAGLWQGQAGEILKKEVDLFIHECFPSFARSCNTLWAKAVCSRQTRWLKPHTEGKARIHFQPALPSWSAAAPAFALALKTCKYQQKSQTWLPSKRYLGQYPSATEPATGIHPGP